MEKKNGRDLCRVTRYEGKYAGYRNDILTENLNEREKAILICKVCEGIMREACISESEEQFCLCCKRSNTKETPDISVRKMISSLKCSCPLSVRGCVWLGTQKDCEDHLDRCGYVKETCKLKCGVVLGRDRLRIHEKEKCPQRKVKCDHCLEDFKSCELNEHLDKCPKMEVSCGLKCGRVVRRQDMERHIEYDCGMARETCKLCEMKLTRDRLKIHVKDTCEQREIECKYCHTSVKFCDYPKHFKECKIPCAICKAQMNRRHMAEHLKDYCPEKEFDCPFVKYKCLARMKRKDVDKHLEEKETKHLGLKLTAMEDLITKQSEEITKQSKEITKQTMEINKSNENIKKQNKEMMRMEREIISQQTEELHFITDTCKIVWKIENVTDRYRSSESIQYEVATGHKFSFRFQYNRELYMVFQAGGGNKCDRPFIAKCHIVFSSHYYTAASYLKNTLNCGKIEVKQKDLTKGCERTIASITKADMDKYSRSNPIYPSKRYLTLEIYLTLQ